MSKVGAAAQDVGVGHAPAGSSPRAHPCGLTQSATRSRSTEGQHLLSEICRVSERSSRNLHALNAARAPRSVHDSAVIHEKVAVTDHLGRRQIISSAAAGRPLPSTWQSPGVKSLRTVLPTARRSNQPGLPPWSVYNRVWRPMAAPMLHSARGAGRRRQLKLMRTMQERGGLRDLNDVHHEAHPRHAVQRTIGQSNTRNWAPTGFGVERSSVLNSTQLVPAQNLPWRGNFARHWRCFELGSSD
eukprot:SAG31_NODE_654_length_13128_cov_10.472408_1_plen_243_part_00